MGRENGHYGLEEFLEPISIQLPAAFFETSSRRRRAMNFSKFIYEIDGRGGNDHAEPARPA